MLFSYCQGVECQAVLGSAQKGSGEAKITLISIFFSHNRAYTESTWPSFRLLAPPLGTDTPPLYQLTRDWYIPIPQISAGVFTYQSTKYASKLVKTNVSSMN